MSRRGSPRFDTLRLALVLGLLRLSGTLAKIRPPSGPTAKTCPTVPAFLRPPRSQECAAPTDDGQAFHTPLAHSPWTHPHVCRRYGRKPSDKFCVYTNSRHGMGGISLVTTPERAASGVDVLDEEVPVAGTDHSPAYEIVDVPGKGKGVVATRPIGRYERFMADYAALVVDMDVASKLRRVEGYRLLHAATDQLADPGRVLSLGRSVEAAEDVVEDVLRTNAFHSPFAGEPHMALYPTISMNHDCKPKPGTLLVNVAAARDIQPGEEITISYITLGQTRKQRRRALERWGFTCTCALCTAPAPDRAASDARRMKVDVLRDEYRAAFEARDPGAAIAAANGVLALLHAEELFPMYAEPHENLARVYWAVGDTARAVESAERSLRVLVEQGYVDAAPGQLEMLLQSFG